MINAQSLAKMKPASIIINTGRGPLVNEQDLADALNNGTIAGYGTDVLSVEPPKADNPLIGLENCHITPHIAWAGVETRHRLMGVVADNLRHFIAGAPINRV